MSDDLKFFHKNLNDSDQSSILIFREVVFLTDKIIHELNSFTSEITSTNFLLTSSTKEIIKNKEFLECLNEAIYLIGLFSDEINKNSRDIGEVCIQMNHFLLSTSIGLMKEGKYKKGSDVIYEEVKNLEQNLIKICKDIPKIKTAISPPPTQNIGLMDSPFSVELDRDSLVKTIQTLFKTILLMEKQLNLMKELISFAHQVAMKTEIINMDEN